MERTVTDVETAKKAELDQLIADGASVEQILAVTKELSAIILEAAEAEAALKFQGHTWTPEQRAALSAKLKGRPGKPWTEEQKQAMRDKWTPEKKAELSAKLTGRHLTEEQKQKLSNSLRAGKAQRVAEQTALQNRIAELERMLQEQGVSVSIDAYATEASESLPSMEETADTVQEEVTENVGEPEAVETPSRGRRGFGRRGQ